MGRMSAYTGKEVTWEQAMDSKLDLMPKQLALGPLPVVRSPSRARRGWCRSGRGARVPAKRVDGRPSLFRNPRKPYAATHLMGAGRPGYC